MKKIVAFTAGRRNGNSEVLAKRALMEAEKMGVQVELIRLNDCQLNLCKACPGFPCTRLGPEGCIYAKKDDGVWLTKKFLDCDGYIMAAPVWTLSAPASVLAFRDRVLGFKMDYAKWERDGVPEWAKGKLKRRAGALISVGGAQTKNWTSLGIASLYLTVFTPGTQVVDQMDVHGVAGGVGCVTLYEDLIERAAELGRRLAEAVLHPERERTLFGDKEGRCPGCGQNLMMMYPNDRHVECAICGRSGQIVDKDGSLSLVFPPEDEDDRLTIEGLAKHQEEIAQNQIIYAKQKDTATERLETYTAYKTCEVLPPSRTEKSGKGE